MVGPTLFNVDYDSVCTYGFLVKMDQASNIHIIVGLILDNNLHTETSINMTISQSNDLEDGRLIKIKVEAIKVDMELETIPENPNLFPVWA